MPGAGAVTAVVAAMAASLVELAARVSQETWSDAGGVIAQAASLRRRAAPMAAEDARAYQAALEAMRDPSGETPEDRDRAIEEALLAAADVPLAIAEVAADVAALAAVVAERGEQRVRPDAAAAGVLAAAAARAAGNLVAVNLVSTADDPRVVRARILAEKAADSIRGTIDLESPT
jgi:formiminotetrahydrofolate cyclodeaminase